MNILSASAPRRRVLLAAILTTFFLNACKKEDPAPSPAVEAEPQVQAQSGEAIEVNSEKAAQTALWLYEKNISALTTLIQSSQVLSDTITTFLSKPEDASLQVAQNQWKQVFADYQKLAPFLFFSSEELSKNLTQWHFTLAARPLQPGYLDSYDVYQHSGIVNDISLSIDAEALRKQHGLTDTEEVTLGLYAIEFLLWGDKELSDPSRFKVQKKVPAELAQSDLKIEELPNNRRRQLLALLGELLADDMKSLYAHWQNEGALFLLYQRLSASDKVIAYHKGFIDSLSDLDALLASSIDHGESPDGTSTNTYPQRFELRKTEAVIERLAAIEEFYANGAEATLANALDEKSLEEINAKIDSVKKQLTE